MIHKLQYDKIAQIMKVGEIRIDIIYLFNKVEKTQTHHDKRKKSLKVEPKPVKDSIIYIDKKSRDDAFQFYEDELQELTKQENKKTKEFVPYKGTFGGL